MRPLPLARADADAAPIVVGRRCNQRCGFCDGRADHDGEQHYDDSVRSAIDRARATGARRIVLTGGEPALRNELPAWIALAARDDTRVVLETNGTIFAYASRARAVRTAGLAEARVALPAGDDAAAEAITRDPGGLARALEGIAHLAEAGIEITITIPLTDEGAPSLPALVARAHAAAGRRLRAFEAHLLRDTAIDLPRAADSIAAAARAAAGLPDGGVPFRFAPGAAPPPCSFAGIDAPRGLFSALDGTPRDACAPCALFGICPGPSQPVPDHALAPVDAARARALAPLLPDRARAAVLDAASGFHYFDDALGQVAPGATLRLVYTCNQKCPMCFVDTSLGSVPAPLWRGALAEAIAGRVRYLQISGGEPTLSADLVAAVAAARTGGIAKIELQTNALRCADRAYARALAEAGLTDALVSLHGATDATADAVTLAPGTAARTALGIDALLEAGVAVQLHFVVNGVNFRETPAFVERVLARWSTRPSLLFSFVAPMDRVPKEGWLVPRFTDAAPPLRAALDRCREAGLRFSGPGSFCGLPLCILDGDRRYYPDRHPVPDGSVSSEFLHPPVCDSCSERAHCRGVRTAYAALHGVSELHSIDS
jgi:MoaA/NifB/PqqE/SkfB family radical SAM enzyme